MARPVQTWNRPAFSASFAVVLAAKCGDSGARMGIVGSCDNGLEVLTGRIIHCVFRVHRALGPGFLEKIYRRALAIELRQQNLAVDREKSIVIMYAGEEAGRHRLDLLVEGRVIIELKTVEVLNRTHYAQVRSYLKATGFPIALLINFASASADIRRVEPH